MRQPREPLGKSSEQGIRKHSKQNSVRNSRKMLSIYLLLRVCGVVIQRMMPVSTAVC